MGIRFRCPNGHKLNVKSFLAGKTGRCPECGTQVRIPLESDPSLVKANRRTGEGASISEGQGPSGSAPTDGPRPRPTTAPLGHVPPEVSSTKRRPSPPGAAAGSPPVSRADAGNDPLSEMPQSKWYVRPPTGGQFGPAPAAVFRGWINEGRVTPDAHVWREGWPTWRCASEIWPELGKPTLDPKATRLSAVRSATPEPALAEPAAAATIPRIVADPVAPSASDAYRRRKSTKTAITVTVILSAACMILLATLIYIIQSRN